MFELLISLCLVSSSFIFIRNRLDGDEILAISIMSLIASLSLLTKPKRSVDYRSLVFLHVFAVLTLFYSKYGVTIYTAVNTLIGLFAIKIIADNITLNIKHISRVISFIYIINAIIILLQYAGLDNYYYPYFSEVAGSFGRPWVLGCFTVMTMAFIPKKLLILPLWFLFISKSSICVAFGMMVLAYLNKEFIKKHFIKFAIVGVVVMFSYMYYDQGIRLIDEHRWQVWKNGLAHFDNIWIGRGIGTWAHSAFVHKHPTEWLPWLWAHNEYYQQAFEQGISGLILMIFACIAIYRSASSKVIKASLLGMFGLAFFHPILHWPRLTFFIVFIIAYALAQGSKRLNYVIN